MTTQDLQAPYPIEMPDEPVYDIGTGGVRLKKRQTVELTNSFAERFLEMAEFSGDRPLHESHVVFLARQMEMGLFRWEQVNFATCLFDGREYRMNGQHTCWARVSANLPEGTRCPINRLTYEADSYDDMRQLYATIDRGKPRSRGQVVISYLAGRKEFQDYSKALLTRLAEGMSVWKWTNDAARSLHTGDEQAYLMLKEHYKLTHAVGEFYRTSDTSAFKHLRRAPVIGAMFATFDRNPQESLAFWTAVRDGSGLVRGDARHTLRDLLMTTRILSGKGAVLAQSEGEKGMTRRLMYNACIICWNAFRQNRQLTKISMARLDLDERPKPV